MDFSILSWNVRGLNNLAKRKAVQTFVSDLKCNIVCLQETKISDLTNALVIETLGPRYRDNFISLPAVGSRGGILIACSNDFEITSAPMPVSVYCVSGTVRCKSNGEVWSITGVYGP